MVYSSASDICRRTSNVMIVSLWQRTAMRVNVDSFVLRIYSAAQRWWWDVSSSSRRWSNQLADVTCSNPAKETSVATLQERSHDISSRWGDRSVSWLFLCSRLTLLSTIKAVFWNEPIAARVEICSGSVLNDVTLYVTSHKPSPCVLAPPSQVPRSPSPFLARAETSSECNATIETMVVSE